MSKQVFGDFVEPDEGQDYLKINFALDPTARQARWRNGGLSTVFVLNYWETFFPATKNSSLNQKTEAGYTLRFVANELLENILRHSDAVSSHPSHFGLYFPPGGEARFYAANSVKPEAAEAYQSFVRRLLTEDLDELYVRQVESTMEEGNTSSGLGFLTLLSDYQAKLAWKFEAPSQSPQVVIATTMVQLPLSSKS